MNAVTKFRCPTCKGLHDTLPQAKKCCPVAVREIYVCQFCGAEFFSIIDAGQCHYKELDKPRKGSNDDAIFTCKRDSGADS